MIHVAVGDDNSLNGTLAQILLHQLHGGPGTLYAHQRVKDDPAGVTLDQGQVRHIVAAHLVDALPDFKQTISVIAASVLPQAGVDGIRSLLVVAQEAVRRLVPDHVAVAILQF